MLITKETVGREVYIYFNGVLVYKRWLNYNKGRMFYEGETIGRAK